MATARTSAHDRPEPGAPTVVIGGGPAGLTCAWRLKRAGRPVLLLEAGATPGGNVRTLDADGYRIEHGPHSFMGSATLIMELVEELGLEALLRPTLPQADARYIVRAGRAHRAPDGLRSFLTSGLLSPAAKLRLASEPLRRPGGTQDDTARDFFRRRFGREGADILAGAFINGVYAGDPAELSAPAAFPLFWEFERQAGSMLRGGLRRARARRRTAAPARKPSKGLYSFEGGLGTLTRALARGLGTSYRGSSPVLALERSSVGFQLRTETELISAAHVVLATPPAAAARLLTPCDRILAGHLAAIPLAPVAVVHAGFRRHLERLPNAFGFLAAADQGTESLGILFPSRLFPDRLPDRAAGHQHSGDQGPAEGKRKHRAAAPAGDLLCAFFGGRRRPELLDLDDRALGELMVRDLRQLYGVQEQPTFLRVLRHRQAIPQLVVGHLARRRQIEQRLALGNRGPGRLALAGNYLTGVGLKDAVQSGAAAADHLLETTSGPDLGPGAVPAPPSTPVLEVAP